MRRGPRHYAVVIAALAGCTRVPTVQSRHPASYEELLSFAPECAKPGPSDYEPCNDAAAILEADPRKATEIFIREWRQLVLYDMPDSRYSGVTPDPLGDVEQRRAVALTVAALDRTMRPALNRVYEKTGDPYSRAMHDALSGIEWMSPMSCAAFEKADEVARLLPRPTPTEPVIDL